MRPRGTVSRFLGFLFLLLFFLWSSPALAETENRETKVRFRGEFSRLRREQLTDKLRKITGWGDLTFNKEGTLRLGTSFPVGGSATARSLLSASISNRSVFVLEDASKRKDVVFCRIVLPPANTDINSDPVYLIQIDFADFDNLIGDRPAQDAFNSGWGFLHELNHVISDSSDSKQLGQVGDCEDHINTMRRELRLPERSDYLFTYLPLSQKGEFTTKFVRLPFDQKDTVSGKQRRYWLTWDANVVGGLEDNKQIAALK